MKEREPANFLDRAVARMSRLAMLLPAISVMAIFYEVFVRYVFNRPTVWAFDLSWWLAGTTYLLAGPYVMQQRAHIRITLLYDALPLVWRRAADLLGCALMCFFCFAVIWGGFNEASAKLLRWEGLGTAWNPPIPAVMLPLILLTVAVLAVQSVCNLIADWNESPTSSAPPSADSDFKSKPESDSKT